MLRVINFNELKRVNKQNTVIINTTSRSESWSKNLSPFYISGGHLYNNYHAENVENAWQFSKVYKCHIDSEGNPIPQYFQWAINGWSSKRAYRYPMGKGAIPEYSFWNGEKLGYIDARKQIYIPIYSRQVKLTQAFSHLKTVYQSCKDSNIDMYLVDFDAYNHIDKKISFEGVINDPKRKCGHGFVLYGLLEGLI